MPRHLDVKFFPDSLKGVTKHPMPNIVDKGRRQSNVQLVFLNLVSAGKNMPTNYFHQPAGGMKYANAMGKPRVRCPRIHEIGKTQLLHSAKTLELWCLNDLPNNAFELIFQIEDDQIVKWISNALGAQTGCHRSPPNGSFPFPQNPV